MILAHRGITANARDNSAAAIDAVIAANNAGANIGIEIDVRSAADALVMLHCGIESGLVVTSTELSLLGADDILTFDQAVSLLEPVPFVNFEIKDPGISKRVLPALADRDPDTILLSSFFPVAVSEYKDSGFPTGLLIDRDVQWEQDHTEADVIAEKSRPERDTAVLELFDAVGSDFLNVHFSLLTAALIDAVAARRKQLLVWGVNSAELMRTLIEHPHVAHVITDYPLLVSS